MNEGKLDSNPIIKGRKVNEIMESEDIEYGGNAVEDMMTDYDYHVNTGELPELFDDESVDDFIANLNDWD